LCITDPRRTPGIPGLKTSAIPGLSLYPAIRFDTAAETPESLVVENRCITSVSRTVFAQKVGQTFLSARAG